MPGFVTHYLFGRDVYHKIANPSLKKTIYDNRGAYGLGLQGPDIFFYYLPSYLLQGYNLGSLSHTNETRALFLGLIRSCQLIPYGTDRAIAEAYLLGFLGHYTLDSIGHPYIYAMTHYQGRSNDYFAHHAYLETDIDTALLDAKLHRHPHQFHAANTITLTLRQKKVIASLLFDAYRYAFPELKIHKRTIYLSIFSMGLALRILHDNSGQKKVLFRFAEKHFLGYPLFSPLVPSDSLFFRTDPFNMRHATWCNPWDSSLTSEESFFDLYKKAEELYLSRIKKLNLILCSDSHSQHTSQLIQEFLKDYGNYSFHSGLDCSIPS